LKVTGIFETGIDRIDAQWMLVDIDMLQTFMPENGNYTQIEIWAKHPSELTSLRRNMLMHIPNGYIRLNTLEEYNRLIFDWLAILHTNVWIILVLMALVAITGMSTTILILIIERTATIGLLLSMGATYQQIAKLFRWQALLIAVIGIGFGNVLALGIVWVQNTFQFIQLNQEVYFIPAVKFQWSWWYVLTVNLVSLVVISLSLWLPSRYIKKIDLIKAIQFK
jgi:lipoprotein-releasing system permease protein